MNAGNRLSRGIAIVLFAAGSGAVWPSVVSAETLSIASDVAGDVIPTGANGNTVIISAGTIGGEVDGGFSDSSSVSGNTVIISGGTIEGDICGGSAPSGEAAGNTLIISGGTLKGENVCGGYSRYGDVDGNTVMISGGAITGEGNVCGGLSPLGNASGNTLTISGGTMSVGGYVCGAYVTNGNAVGNVVNISGGEIHKSVYGAYSEAGNTIGNTVNISGGTTYADVFGGCTVEVSAGNTVNIQAGTVQTVYGGYSYRNSATGNTVNIQGGTVTVMVCGGYADLNNATGNTVNLLGGDLTQALIYGGFSTATSTGNTLNVYTAISASCIALFQNYNFYVPSTLTGTSALLTLSGSAALGSSSAVSSLVIAGDSAYTTGDTITLISAGSLTGSLLSTSITARKGLATLYTTALSLSGTALTATLGEASLNPAVKSLSEAQSAAMANINTGADLVAGNGMANAAAAAAAGNGQPVGFVGSSAGEAITSTGSEVDVKSFGILAGAAGTHGISAGKLTTGAFIEAGWGSYTTDNEISGVHVRADGHANYEGGGVLVRLDRVNGTYYEGSLHAGHLDSTYSSDDLTDYDGRGTSYDVGSPYYSAHMSIGHVRKLDARNSLDFYGRYLWSYVPSRSVMAGGDHFNFASVTSNRLRLGIRWTKRCDEGMVYAGLAAEREFSGSQRASVAGVDAAAPSLRGTTGIVEIGWRVPQSRDHRTAVDIGLAGQFGKRQGIGGSLSFSWGW